MKMSALYPLPLAALLATPAFAQVMPPADYVATAASSDLFERQSSTLVLETTTIPAIRSFATMMVNAHSQSAADVASAARRSRVRVASPMLTPLQTEMIAQLRAETGPARDAVYVAQQRAAHNQALNLQQAYARDGTAAPLKRAAAAIVPVVEHHIMLLKAM